MGKIVFENVSKVYGEGDQQITALNNISLQVNSGEFVAVVGPSGSGKSTFLAICGALLKPSSGKILLNDTDLTSLTDKELSRIRLNKIGFILQTSNLVPYLQTLDQLLLVKRLKGEHSHEDVTRAKELLNELGLSHRLKNYPDALSGGERQRVAIARAFMNDPTLILADEPTASLDSKRGEEVVKMLAAEVKKFNKAAIMVTHDERMLKHCDRVIRITDGAIVEESLEMAK